MEAAAAKVRRAISDLKLGAGISAAEKEKLLQYPDECLFCLEFGMTDCRLDESNSFFVFVSFPFHC